MSTNGPTQPATLQIFEINSILESNHMLNCLQ